MPDPYRIAIIGAASLKGKELVEALNDSVFAGSDIVLMDDQDAIGKLESVGDEVTFIQPIAPLSFAGVDFTFFASDPETTQNHWKAAGRAGSTIIDLSGALESERGVVVLAPWLEEEGGGDVAGGSGKAPELDLATPAVAAAHAATLMLALVLSRLQRAAAVHSAFATVLEPTSEHGRAAMDELHQQTINLLSFQTLPKAIYDTQIAYTLTPAVGAEAKVDLRAVEERIVREYGLLSRGRLPKVDVQLIQAPVFHGYTMSLGFELERAVTLDEVLSALESPHLDVVQSDDEAPSNLSAAGQENVMVRVRPADGAAGAGTRFWLWAAADNLNLSAQNAVACAELLRRLRPQGTVQ